MSSDEQQCCCGGESVNDGDLKGQSENCPSGAVQTVFHIENMDCPTEEALIRQKLPNTPGVASLDFNLIKRNLTVAHLPEAMPDIVSALTSLGFKAEILDKDEAQSPPQNEKKSGGWLVLLLSGLAALMAEVVFSINDGNNWLVVVLAVAAIIGGGLPTYKKGWIAIRNFNLNMNALMSIAVTGAMLIGHWPEAAMVMVLFALAEFIEAKSLDRARNAIRNLMALTPEFATVRQPDGSWLDVEAQMIPLGSRIRVKPGERIALDGKVVEGQSAVNQAPITGESLPVEKARGDQVFAGTINESGSLEYTVTALANDSTLARIIHAVEEAQGSRAPTQRFVDQFARYYTPLIFLLAVLVAVLSPFLTGATWLDGVYKALVLLVIACPCALVISTPVSIVSGLAAAAQNGILVKGGLYLEIGRKMVWLALDKTGTITHGKPAETDFQVWKDAVPENCRLFAASLSHRSDHPVSRAIAESGDSQEIALLEVSDFEALPGRGTQGKINNSLYRLGNHRMVEELGFCLPELELQLHSLENQGKTVVMLMDEQRVLALFAVADTVKESSKEAIADLHRLGVKTIMLTGDNSSTAKAIAEVVGVDQAEGDLLPEDKLSKVEQLLSSSGKVGMVGDGINDAPALARADIGFAMGAAGSDTAIETADVALMDDDLRKIPKFVRLSRSTAAILAQNITLAIGIKAVFLALTFTGHATMWMAVFADMGTSLLVVFNGLRLKRK